MAKFFSENGSATLELALLTPFMVVVTLYIIHAGTFFAAKQTVGFAARETARIAAMKGNAQLARNQAAAVLSELPKSGRSAVSISMPSKRGGEVRVSISYTKTYDLMIAQPTKTVTGEAVMRRER